MSSSLKIKQQAEKTLTPAIWRHNVTSGTYQMPHHIKMIDRLIVSAITGARKEKIYIIEGPPRHGKSEYFSMTLPAWYLGRYPKNRFILTSYNSTLAKGFGRKSRDLFAEYASDSFGLELSRDVYGAAEWETSHGGGLLASGIGGTITGKGANIFVVDDYLKNSQDALSETIRDTQWEWFSSTVETRLEPGAIVVIMATRWHKDDLIGRILNESRDNPGYPEVFHWRMPAICEDAEHDPLGRKEGDALWPERWPKEELARKKAAMLPYWWLAMYQQRPEQHGETEWPSHYFGDFLWTKKYPKSYEIMCMACDPSKGKDASKGDYTGLLKGGMKGGKLYVGGLVRRMPVEDIVDEMIEMRNSHPGKIESIGLESNAWQDLIMPIANHRCEKLKIKPLPIMLVNNSVRKELRISRIGPFLRNREIVFEDTADMRRLVAQLQEFPLGEHDDGPDALEMLIRLMLYLCGASDSMSGQYPEDEIQLFGV